MELRKLAPSYYLDNPVVQQALDFDMASNSWNMLKVRGHGIVEITFNNLIFAFPVRSHIRHRASFILEVNRKDRHIKGMGLDYSKALLIKHRHHILDEVFLLTSKQAGRKLVNKGAHISNQFNAYVAKYILSFRKRDTHVLNSYEYRYTTLINYHVELGVD
ncbi:MAG: hypothetical protein GYB30_02090 [Gammaproteobacteria bacterium]|nr:hypothetical protein [Gammaproteobacteria bacterium]